MKYSCPCCGMLTYNVPPEHDNGFICPVCFWENDRFVDAINEPSDSNHGLSLLEARQNYAEFGACCEKMLKYCRKPLDEERPTSDRD